MAKDATEETESGPLRLEFDRSVEFEFRGSAISSDGGLLLHRELDDTLGLTDMAAALIGDTRSGRNGRLRLAGFLRQSVFSRLAGYVDVNDATRGITSLTVRREMRRRSGIEPVIGHLKEDGHLERNHLAEGDAINAVLCAVGHNMRLLATWIRLLVALLVAIILSRPPQNQVDHHLAIAA